MISIIIPVLNEEKNLPSLINSLKIQEEKYEVIFVDGGSTDQSLKIISLTEHTLIKAKSKGRAYQLNEGAEQAKGEILFFLHADCILPPFALSELKKALKNEKIIAGSFIMKLSPNGFLYSVYNTFTRINSIFFTYGDAGLFMNQRTFEHIGGYKEIPIMEDVEIQKRLRKIGQFQKLKLELSTSSRRFQKNGSFFQIMTDIFIVLAWHLKVNDKFLKKIYPDDHR